MGLKRSAFDRIVDTLAAYMREVQPTPFACEAPFRHGLRAGLCLTGWRWAAADLVAADIVRTALEAVKAKRPSWEEGQSEFVTYGGALIERTRCVRCGKPLPEERRKYCSDLCAAADFMAMARLHHEDDVRAYQAAYRLTWIARQPERRCEFCGGKFRSAEKVQRFCSADCHTRSRRVKFEMRQAAE